MVYRFNLFNYIGGLTILFFVIAFWVWSRVLGVYVEMQPVMTIIPILMVIGLFSLAIADNELKLLSDELKKIDEGFEKE